MVGVSGFSFAEAFALALSGPDTRRSIGRILAGEVPPYRPFPEGSGSTSGRFRLADKDSVQVLTLKTGVERQPVRLTLPAEAQPALLVTDLDGSDAYFKNQEALDAIAELAEEGEQPQQAGIEPDLAVAPGVFEFEVPRDTYAVITVGTRRPAGAEMAFASSVPLGRYDDGDEDRALRVGERVEGAIDGLEAGGDTYLVELQRGEVVEIFAGSATGDVGYAVRPPGQQGSEAILVDDSDVGLYGTDAKDNYEAQASGVHRLTVFSSDGRATGYVLRVRRS